MGLVHERTHIEHPASIHEGHEVLHPLDLGDDVANSGCRGGIRHHGDGRAEVVDLPQGVDPQQCRRLLTGGTSGSVLAIVEGVLGPGVDDEQLQPGSGQIERHLTGGGVQAVQQQRPSLLGAQ